MINLPASALLVKVLVNGSGEWFAPFIPLVAALLGAAIGGSIALFSARSSDRRKQKAEDLRQWDSRLIDIYRDIDEATLVFYNTWRFTEGDANHLGKQVPEMEDAIRSIGSAIAVIEIIAPPCEAASRQLLEEARASMADAEDAIPLKGDRLRAFQIAHSDLVKAIRDRIRVDSPAPT